MKLIGIITLTLLPILKSHGVVSSFPGGSAALSTDEVLVYENDFGTGIAGEWSLGRLDRSPSGEDFLGRFENNVGTVLTVNNLPEHSRITVSFDLYVIHSWDGSNFGADTWTLGIVGGETLIHTTFANPLNGTANNPQAFPGTYPGDSFPARTGAAEVDTLGYLGVSPTRFGDSTYALSFTFDHTGDSISFNFYANGFWGGVLGQGLPDESWGLDNVKVLAVIPEPGCLAYLAVTGFFAWGLRVRKR